MSPSWFLMQLFLRVPLQVPPVMISSALTAMSYCLVGALSYRPESQFISRQELMDVLHLALDSP